jgi:muramoyltetrapeptide carboxypeptidase
VETTRVIFPRRMRPGSSVALVAPAGPLPPGAVERAFERVRSLGWEPLLGRYARCRDGYLAGSDEERLEDLSAALTPHANDAIWCLRGGYGTMRIVADLDLSPLRTDPRPLIGFSDNTVLHLAATRIGVVTFHGPHAGVADFPAFARDSLRATLADAEPVGMLPMPQEHPPPITISPGVAEGPLMGGNLSLLAATVGTPYQVRARGAILFMEEVGESAYRLDRLLTQLLLADVFAGVAAVVVGAINECPDEGPSVPPAVQILRDRLGHLGVPVACGFPFGHVPASWTLPIGAAARLDATGGTLEILEAAVSG